MLKMIDDLLLRQLIDEIDDYAIITIDPAGTILTWNKGAERIKGYQDTEILGKNFRLFYSVEDLDLEKPTRLLDKARSCGKAMDEGWRLRKDGSRFWGSITITAIYDHSNNVIGFGKVTRDLTSYKQAELVKVFEIKNKELERLNYIASHDLQEPLRTIRNFSMLLKEDVSARNFDELDYYLNTIDRAANRMSSLIHALLDYSRLGRKSEVKATDCNVVVQDLITDIGQLISSSDALIQTEALPIIPLYELEFRQLLQNLLVNAIKFRQKDRRVQIKIYATSQADTWTFYVEDNGIGIQERHVKRIFDLFQRIETEEKIEGHGIGLANCKKIAELHGGDIGVISTPGSGSTFYFTISKLLL